MRSADRRRALAGALALAVLSIGAPPASAQGGPVARRPDPAAVTRDTVARRDSLPGGAARGQSAARKLGNAIERAAEARAAARATTRFDDTFRKYSKRSFGPAFDWTYFKAQAMAESGLDTAARSYVGARGLMQLMPSTYKMIQSRRPELGAIDDPEWNIAAGIMHDRYLWRLWSKDVSPETERLNFVFGSYNAGEGTIGRATATARAQNLDHARWSNIETIAPTVPRWRYRETLVYVRRIDSYYDLLRARRTAPAPSVSAPR